MRFPCIIPILFITAMNSRAFAATLHVPADYTTIQSCIDAAVSGQDECVVAPGTYNELINFLGKAITLRSESGPEVTIIDGTRHGTVITCYGGEGPDTVLESFTVTGGDGGAGGGMYNLNSSPTVTNCIFSGNNASVGGGIFNTKSSPTVTHCTFSGNAAIGGGGGGIGNSESNPAVTNCTFIGNTADSGGGGIENNYNSSPTVTNCTFAWNSAHNGGGMFNSDSSPRVTNCTFNVNSALAGGGMYNGQGSSAVVSNCAFTGNTTTLSGGGGMFNSNSSLTVMNCTFIGNTASYGGGMYNSECSPSVTGCTFIANTATDQFGGGGMFNDFDCSPIVTDCTFNRNTADYGGGMLNRGYFSRPTVTHCMFVGNTANSSGGGMFNSFDTGTAVTNCTFSGNMASTGGGMYNSDTWTNSQMVISGVNTLTDGRWDRQLQQLQPDGGYGARILNESTPVLTNCIFWGDRPDEVVNYFTEPVIRFGDVQGGIPVGSIDGGGNIDLDPVFVRNPSDGGDDWGDDPSTPNIDESLNDDFGDLRLQPGSPCINAGDPDFAPQPGETDLDGHAQVLCGQVDMGAYEFGIGDYDCNQMVNLDDVAAWPACSSDPLVFAVQSTIANRQSPIVTGCEALDFDADGDVDLVDFAALQNAFAVMECLGDADCDDADACTSDACEGDGTCSHTAIEGCCNFDFECDDGISCTADTCDANHTCVNAAIPGCIKHTFATFTDPVSGFATQSVRDVNGEIVKFDPVRWSIVYVATGAEYQLGYWPVNGNLLGFGGSFQVRFGTVLGEHRAFFTETGSGTICDFVVTPSSFLIYATNTPVPHT